jgi:glutamate 5-kinase
MSSPRTQYLASVRSVVVKLGTQLLTDQSGRLDPSYFATIAREVSVLRGRGVEVTIVSSGAVAAGVAELSLPKRPTDLAQLQAVAAVGQRRLMDTWAAALEPHKMPVAQILLTREDIDDRTRFLNVRNTIRAAHEYGAVAVINENDTISTSEMVQISFGDNDILAAMVAAALRADLLVLLSVVDGLLDADGKPVRLVESLEQARQLVRVEKSAMGKGGMNSKLEAARMVTDAGETMAVANGRDPDVLVRLMNGEEVGTLFAPSQKKRSSRDRWIAASRPAGSIHVDAGAVTGAGREGPLAAAGGDRQSRGRVRAGRRRFDYRTRRPRAGARAEQLCARRHRTHLRQENRRSSRDAGGGRVRRGRAPKQPGAVLTLVPAGLCRSGYAGRGVLRSKTALTSRGERCLQ